MRSKLASIGAAFERLSGREQIATLLTALALLLLAVWMSAFFIGKDLSAREKRIAAKTEQLEKLAGLRSDYSRRLAEQKRLAADIRQNNGMRLLSYLEDISKQSNVELGNASERGGEPTGSEAVKEVAAEVVVKNVSLDRLYDFLRRIEEGNKLVKVRRLQIKTRYDNPKMLDASITVGTFKTSEG